MFEQGKKYYDALKSVHNLVKDARKVQQTVLLVGDISEMYVTNYQKMLSDPNFTPGELNAIAFGYTKLLEESSGLLEELKTVVNANGLSMSDKERMDVIDRVYRDVPCSLSLPKYGRLWRGRNRWMYIHCCVRLRWGCASCSFPLLYWGLSIRC